MMLPRRFFGFAALLTLAAALHAADVTFTVEDRLAAGLPKLAAGEQSALDALVARELTAARQGGVRAFGGTFVSRRTEPERASAGLDHLTPEEQAKLNELVATALASRPNALAFLPAHPRILAGEDCNPKAASLQLHGEVSLFYGWGGGGSFKGGSLITTVADPKHNFALTIGYSQISGKGCLLWDDEPVNYLRRP